MDLIWLTWVAVLVAAFGYGARPALRWAGRRGWIFYGAAPVAPLGQRSAMALMEFDALLNPAVEHVIEYRRYGDLWAEAADTD